MAPHGHLARERYRGPYWFCGNAAELPGVRFHARTTGLLFPPPNYRGQRADRLIYDPATADRPPCFQAEKAYQYALVEHVVLPCRAPAWMSARRGYQAGRWRIMIWVNEHAVGAGRVHYSGLVAVTVVMASYGLCRTTGYQWLAKVRGRDEASSAWSHAKARGASLNLPVCKNRGYSAGSMARTRCDMVLTLLCGREPLCENSFSRSSRST